MTRPGAGSGPDDGLPPTGPARRGGGRHVAPEEPARAGRHAAAEDARRLPPSGPGDPAAQVGRGGRRRAAEQPGGPEGPPPAVGRLAARRAAESAGPAADAGGPAVEPAVEAAGPAAADAGGRAARRRAAEAAAQGLRRRHAAEDTGVGGFPYLPVDPPDGLSWPVNGRGSRRHAAEDTGVGGFPYVPVDPPDGLSGPVNGRGSGRRNAAEDTGVGGFPYLPADPPDGLSRPVNGHGLDRAERDAAAWSLNGHTGPINGVRPDLPRVDGGRSDRPSGPGTAGVPSERPGTNGVRPGQPRVDDLLPDGPGIGGAGRHEPRPNGFPADGSGVGGSHGDRPGDGRLPPPSPVVGGVHRDRPGVRGLPAAWPDADGAGGLRPAGPGVGGAGWHEPRPAGVARVRDSRGPVAFRLDEPRVDAGGADRGPGPPPLASPPYAYLAGPAGDTALDRDRHSRVAAGRPGDESTQLLQRYVPANEVLDRESGAPTRRPAGRRHPPRAVVRRRRARRRALEWPVLIVFALLSAYFIRAYVVQTFYIPSGSMHETLLEGDRVLVNKVSYHLHDVHRGDVVVFRRPPDFPVEDDDLIKRVIALPGETVEARDRTIYVNGAQLAEPYVEPLCQGTQDFPAITVPPGRLWVMGDNRCNSSDSRVFGPIDEDLVVGRAFVLAWPAGRLSWL